MTDLIARLEAATEGNRELDVEIHQLRGFITDTPAPYTQSIDAALTLIPDGWTVSVMRFSDGEGYVELSDNQGRFLVKGDTEIYQEAATPALAICIAALKARETPND